MMNDPSLIAKAAVLIAAGKLVAFPTETVYGLGGNARSDAAVAAIYAAKERPSFNPLIVHMRSLEEAHGYAYFSETALALARKFWPGPLTLVLPRRADSGLSLLLSAGLDTVALRVPAHPLAQAFLHAAQLPVAAPSANRSGRLSPTEAAHVEAELGGRVAMILDGGPCEVGIESTVVDMTGEVAVVLRPGSVTMQALSAVAGVVKTAKANAPLASPGMLASHYAPSKPLRLNALEAREGEALLTFGKAKGTAHLSVAGNLEEAAANLFRLLRGLDAGAATSIAVMPVPQKGLGVAINDRLTRAAAPKI